MPVQHPRATVPVQCHCASHPPSSVSNARCSSHIFPSSAAPLRCLFRFTWDHNYPNTYLSHPISSHPIRLTRSHYLGHALGQGTAGLLAIPPHKRFITLERPVSMRFGYHLRSVVWRYDMSLRRSKSPPLTRFGFRLFTRHHSPVGFFLPGRWRFRSLFVTLVGTASAQYNRS